ncbi:MAG: CoA-binding protein [Pseudomonadota bacterium]
MTPNPPDAEIARILTGVTRIALVGASDNPARASHGVGTFLARRGARVVPVNPALVGQSLFGVPVVATLAEAGPVKMVDVFRRSEAVPDVVDQALGLVGLEVIWLQLGVVHEDAAARARARGITVVQDRCPKIEVARLRL